MKYTTKNGHLELPIMTSITTAMTTKIADIDAPSVNQIKRKAVNDVRAIAHVALPGSFVQELSKPEVCPWNNFSVESPSGDGAKASNQEPTEEPPSNAPNPKQVESTQADLSLHADKTGIVENAAVTAKENFTAALDSDRNLIVNFPSATAKGKEPITESQTKPVDRERSGWYKDISPSRWATTNVPDTRDYKQEFIHLRDDHYSMPHQYNKELDAHQKARKENAELSQRLLNVDNDHISESNSWQTRRAELSRTVAELTVKLNDKPPNNDHATIVKA